MSNLNLSQEKLAALRSEYKSRNVRGKYPRQKMLPEYQSLYPWVLPDETDPYFAFCSVCECRLSAKRSDLGKHEGSIKHTENASKKSNYCDHVLLTNGPKSGVILKGGHIQTSVKFEETDDHVDPSSVLKREIKLESNDNIAEITVSDEDDDDNEEDFNENGIYINQEPIVDLVETNNALNLDDQNQSSRDSQISYRSASGETADDEEVDADETYISLPAKRRVSETDYSSVNKVYMTMSDRASIDRRLSMRDTLESVSTASYFPSSGQINSTVATHFRPTQSKQTAPLNTAQTPCKITIKKITAPIITPPIHSALPTSTQKSSTAISILKRPANRLSTTTSVKTDSAITNNYDAGIHIMPSAMLSPLASTNSTTSTIAVRDSFDLFFDSICASVKALPPKLATEGKIRVMQLIGELELRAITESEQQNAMSPGQQNSTVVSTTK